MSHVVSVGTPVESTVELLGIDSRNLEMAVNREHGLHVLSERCIVRHDQIVGTGLRGLELCLGDVDLPW